MMQKSKEIREEIGKLTDISPVAKIQLQILLDIRDTLIQLTVNSKKAE